jgi:hypothetical protein
MDGLDTRQLAVGGRWRESSVLVEVVDSVRGENGVRRVGTRKKSSQTRMLAFSSPARRHGLSASQVAAGHAAKALTPHARASRTRSMSSLRPGAPESGARSIRACSHRSALTARGGSRDLLGGLIHEYRVAASPEAALELNRSRASEGR